MRIILFLLILAVLAVIAAIATGYVNINQTRPAQVPRVSTGNGVTAIGGQTPAFEVETGSVKVQVEDKNVKVPTLQVEPADSGENQNTN